ncbi:MAG: MFS transporter [Bifidobacteriaceae bacterium]|jgi:NNP family nitrate/nitrite transporter-like MFS transporter|nr:MFS transporter [Bifidobacteriaceae bacterium]
MNAAPRLDSPRSWAIVAVAFAITAVGMFNQLAVSALAPEVMAALGVGNTQLSSLMMAPMLGGVVFGLASGGLTDRYGYKRVVSVTFVVSLAGVILRIFAQTFAVFFVAMVLMGLVAAILIAVSPKLLASWFTPQRLGPAMGVLFAAAPVGTAVVQSTAARFGSPGAVYVVGAILAAACFIAWLTVVPARGAAAEASAGQSVTGYLREAIGNPRVWLLATAMFVFMGAQMTYSSFLPTALNADKGLELPAAGTLAAVYTIGSLIGSAALPALAAKIGRVKPFILGCGVFGMAAMGLAWLTAPGWGGVVLLGLAGALVGALTPFVMAAPALLPDIGPRLAGSAGGLLATTQTAGAFVLPTFVIVPIAGANYTLLLGLAALCAGLVALTMAFVPEYGRRPDAARTP